MTLTKDEILEQIADAYVSDDSDAAFNTALQRSFDAGYKDGQSVMPKWTYCEDAMPTEDNEYLVTTHNPTLLRSTWSDWDGAWDVERDGGNNCVIAWMPLPNPAPHRDIPTEQVSQSTEGKNLQKTRIYVDR